MNNTNSHGIEGTLLVVSGPSGSGKTTLCKIALERTQSQLSISATTRPAGKEEIDGRDYYFLSEEEFVEKIKNNEFLEYARVFDHYYGTPSEAVLKKLRQGQTVVLEIDVQGAAQIFSKFPQARGILILPPSAQELRRRLQGRGRDESEVIDKRLAKAQDEINQAQSSGCYQYSIINDKLEDAIEKLVVLIEKYKLITKQNKQ